MPKTTFGSGTIVTPAWFNAQQNLIFDDQDLDGHQAKLTDDALSDSSTSIKSRFSAIADEFLVTIQSGLYIRVEAGIFKNANQEIFNISPTVLLTQDNIENYVYLASDGTLTVSPIHPAGTLLLAVVTTSSGTISSISDRRARFIEPPGATSDVGDFGNAIATLQFVKQSLLTVFFGVNVPTFTFNSQSFSWTSGQAIFDDTEHPITEGIYTFISSDSGWFYAWAEDSGGATAAIIVSDTTPTLATQQLWWQIQLSLGNIQQVIPAKPGFGV